MAVYQIERYEPDRIHLPDTSTFQRPLDTNAYAAGDLVAGSTVNTQVSAGSWNRMTIGNGGSGVLTGITMGWSGTTAMKVMRVHLFTSAPKMANGDNGVFSIASMDFDAYLGSVEVLVDTINGSGSIGFAPCDLAYVLPGSTMYYRLETHTVFTPVSGETVQVKPKVERYS